MVATDSKGSFVGRITLALLETTGWYPTVDYTYSEVNTWGKGKGCNFLNIDDCDFDEFCTGTDFDCDWDSTAYGRCRLNQISGTCSIVGHYSNTICTDENYELKIQNLYTQINNGAGIITY